MKKIVIIGTGKAAKLHYFSYKKFLNQDILFFVDPFYKTQHNNIIVFDTLKEFLDNTNFSPDDVIVDICTPCSEFHSIIEECKLNGFRNIIVEKPFITNKNELESQFSDLNICMVQNYLYSSITKSIKEIIEKNNMQVKRLTIDFSKNRVIDSFNNRGISKNKITSVFEIEFPHELYIADYLLNLNGNFEITDLKIEDMVKDGIRLKNHGYGQIVGKKDRKEIVLRSNLMYYKTVKTINIEFEDGKILEANYLIYDKDFRILNTGHIWLKNDNEIIYQKEFSCDDNMLECLKNFYYCFVYGKYDFTYREKILSFSNLMQYALKCSR